MILVGNQLEAYHLYGLSLKIHIQAEEDMMPVGNQLEGYHLYGLSLKFHIQAEEDMMPGGNQLENYHHNLSLKFRKQMKEDMKLVGSHPDDDHHSLSLKTHGLSQKIQSLFLTLQLVGAHRNEMVGMQTVGMQMVDGQMGIHHQYKLMFHPVLSMVSFHHLYLEDRLEAYHLQLVDSLLNTLLSSH